ncbi:MAG: hypothetical protein M1812_000429 [Candelaria pacifica]|nr:MAG: hypothetical protein M1812_000429 [Candelaria pacifica]
MTAAMAGSAALKGQKSQVTDSTKDVMSQSSTSSGGSMSASFTTYGGCARSTLQCGWFTPNGTYTAAISQHAFGAGPGDPGPACNRCYKISAPGRSTIVVKVADLCPADAGNPLCTDPGAGQGSVADIHVDLCENSGASAAFFGGTSPLVTSGGTAQKVDCSELVGAGPEIGDAETIGKGFPTDIKNNCQVPHLDAC